jgi:flavodoxin
LKKSIYGLSLTVDTGGRSAMKKGLIIFFSQKGSNMRVADAVGTGLRKDGHQVKLWNLREGRPSDPRDYDFFGVGFLPTTTVRPLS